MSSKWGVGGQRREGAEGAGGRVGEFTFLKKERKKWRASWRKRTDVMNLQTGREKKNGGGGHGGMQTSANTQLTS